MRQTVVLLLLAGCGSAPLESLLLKKTSATDGGKTDPSCVVGSLDAPIELSLLAFFQVDQTLRPVAPGGGVQLELGPEGGVLLFLGLRARNVDVCSPVVQEMVLEECSRLQLSFERRTIRMIARDGFAQPDPAEGLGGVSGVVACPVPRITQDVDRSPHRIHAGLTDARGRKGSADFVITPRCIDSQCECFCDADFKLGATCDQLPPDGPPQGGC